MQSDDQALTQARFIAGDWGTSRARFWLCEANGAIIEAREGRGIAGFKGDRNAIAGEFDRLAAGWPEETPAVLCGMVGSISGWRDAGYAPCPAKLFGLGRGGARFTHGERDVLILPGLTTTNRFGQKDVMRSEETQLVGAMDVLSQEIGAGTALVALPGSHNKWCVIGNDRIETFHTAITGELRAVLRDHSVMVGDLSGASADESVFDDGVDAAKQSTSIGLEALVFAVRARQALGEMSSAQADEYLSGLLIGSDIATAALLYAEDMRDNPVFLICSRPLAERYRRASAKWEIKVRILSGEETVLRGLNRAYEAAFVSGPTPSSGLRLLTRNGSGDHHKSMPD